MRLHFSIPLLSLGSLLAASALGAAPPPASRPGRAAGGPGPAARPGRPPAPDPLAAGDRAYAAKSFRAALDAYQQAAARKLVPEARRPLVEYRIARCQGLSQQWDEAMAGAQRV